MQRIVTVTRSSSSIHPLLLRSTTTISLPHPLYTSSPTTPTTTATSTYKSRPQPTTHHLVGWRRWRMLSGSSGNDYSCKELDEINAKFAEAREDIEAAMESKDTIYFDEEAEIARESVKGVLERFEALLEKVSEEEKASLLRSMGLKMQQLKAEVEQLDE